MIEYQTRVDEAAQLQQALDDAGVTTKEIRGKTDEEIIGLYNQQQKVCYRQEE